MPHPIDGLESNGHFWEECPMCGPMVICGKCGNNCCNGGYGEVIGPERADDGSVVMITCDACPSAYEMQKLGDNQQGTQE